MKYLKKYEQHQDILKLNELYENLTNKLSFSERKAYNYILGITSDNYENLSESAFSDIVSRLKSAAKKGILTATLFSSLMNTPGFSQTFNQLTSSEKTEIKQMIKDDSDGKKSTVYSDNETITIDIGSYFKSGQYKLSESDIKSIESKLNGLKGFINKNGGDVKITIESSESRVPNKDAETGEKLNKGELSLKRYDIAKSILSNVLGNNFNINKDIKIGGPEYKGDDVNQDKYSDYQYVKVKVTVNKDIWSFKKKERGAQATKENGYVGASYKFDARPGSGIIKLEPGSIPDRCKVFVDGKVIGDTGFFSDKEHTYSEFKYVPLYILSLTKMYNDNPNSEAIEGVRVIDVNSIDQLKDIILKDKSYDINKDNRNRLEINDAYKQLLNMVSTGKTVKIALYEKNSKSIPLTLIESNKEVKIKVYSPVRNTEFSISAEAGSN